MEVGASALLPVASADPGDGPAAGQEGEGGGGRPLAFRHRLHRRLHDPDGEDEQDPQGETCFWLGGPEPWWHVVGLATEGWALHWRCHTWGRGREGSFPKLAPENAGTGMGNGHFPHEKAFLVHGKYMEQL